MNKYELLVGNTSINLEGVNPQSAILSTNIFGTCVLLLEKVYTEQNKDAWIVQLEVQSRLTVAYIKCVD